MATRCSWCGVELTGEVVGAGEVGVSSMADNKSGCEYYEVGFCCDGCAWCWQLEYHGIIGLTGKEARRHLIEEHGLKSGAPAGGPSQECCFHFSREASRVLDAIFPGKSLRGA